ncbi:unnamed protein product [Arabidopsis halleri]
MREETQLISDELLENAETSDYLSQTQRCRVDGSWKQSDPTMGLGWWCFGGDEHIVLLGA